MAAEQARDGILSIDQFRGFAYVLCLPFMPLHWGARLGVSLAAIQLIGLPAILSPIAEWMKRKSVIIRL